MIGTHHAHVLVAFAFAAMYFKGCQIWMDGVILFVSPSRRFGFAFRAIAVGLIGQRCPLNNKPTTTALARFWVGRMGGIVYPLVLGVNLRARAHP